MGRWSDQANVIGERHRAQGSRHGATFEDLRSGRASFDRLRTGGVWSKEKMEGLSGCPKGG